jgi:hypothetical protein
MGCCGAQTKLVGMDVPMPQMTSKESLVSPMTSVTYAARTVGEVLATVHEGWINQVESSLLPATDLRTDFWSRWGATRFLGDQFGDRFRLECAFAAALEGFLPPGAGRRLTMAGRASSGPARN